MSDGPLRVECAPVGLEALDRIPVDALVLTPFLDDIPLRGIAGYCDWRLNGRISRLVESGFFQARLKEVLLTNTLDYIQTERIFLFGQGKRYGMDLTIFQRSLERILMVLKKARVNSYAIELPGIDPGPLSVPQAVSAFLDAAAEIHPQGRVCLLSPYPRFTELVSEISSDDDRISLSLPPAQKHKAEET